MLLIHYKDRFCTPTRCSITYTTVLACLRLYCILYTADFCVLTFRTILNAISIDVLALSSNAIRNKHANVVCSLRVLTSRDTIYSTLVDWRPTPPSLHEAHPYPLQYILPSYKYHYDLPPSFADGRASCDCLRTPFSSSLESLTKRATSSADLPARSYAPLSRTQRDAHAHNCPSSESGLFLKVLENTSMI